MPPKSITTTVIPKATPKKYRMVIGMQDNLVAFQECLYHQRGQMKGNMYELNDLPFLKQWGLFSGTLFKMVKDGEITGLTVDDFNFDHRTITFNNAFFTQDFKNNLLEMRKARARNKIQAKSRENELLRGEIERLKSALSSASNSVAGTEDEFVLDDDDDEEAIEPVDAPVV